jgi:hypothetical protein
MHEYDIALKALITDEAEGTLRLLGAAGPVTRWLNVELPKVQNQRVDLLGETANGELLQIELQSSNHMEMHLRMLEYGVGIWRLRGVFPRQIVLYVGNERLRMPDRYRSAGIDYRYELIDVRDLDGEAMLESDHPSDNILALLTGLDDKVKTVRRIVAKLARLERIKRQDALRKLLILCGLRGLERTYNEEEENMPIDLDIRDNKIIGPLILRALEKTSIEVTRQMTQQVTEQVTQQVTQQVTEQVTQQITKLILRRQIEKRFGTIPPWADERLQESSQAEAEELAMKVIDARTMEELFD